MDGPNPNASAVPGLPDDLFLEILSRVFPLDLPRFKCVAKAWRRLIDEFLRSREHPRTLRGFLYMDESIWGGDGYSDDRPRGFIDLLPSAPLNIDPSFDFLTKLPWVDTLTIEATCNGLLLFENTDFESLTQSVLPYVVCNPATEQWEAVPTTGLPPSIDATWSTYLVFDPAVSSSFHLIHFIVETKEVEEEDVDGMFSVYTYSSETGKWSHQEVQTELEGCNTFVLAWKEEQFGAFVNGMLHVIVEVNHEDLIVAVDLQGKIQRMIPLPEHTQHTPNIAHSQGCLYFIDKGADAQLSIWVLDDYETQKWVLKDTVSYLDLFGNESCHSTDFHLVTVHPDCSVVFFRYDKNLISYDMDSKAVRVAGTFENIRLHMPIVPYVPHFESMPNE